MENQHTIRMVIDLFWALKWLTYAAEWAGIMPDHAEGFVRMAKQNVALADVWLYRARKEGEL